MREIRKRNLHQVSIRISNSTSLQIVHKITEDFSLYRLQNLNKLILRFKHIYNLEDFQNIGVKYETRISNLLRELYNDSKQFQSVNNKVKSCFKQEAPSLVTSTEINISQIFMLSYAEKRGISYIDGN